MKLMTGIFDRPMTDDDDDERKRPKDGCPTPWKHCWTRHVSWSWTRPRNLDGTARPLAVRCHASTNGVWESPVVCRPRVFSSGPHFSTYGSPTRGSWAVPPQKPRTSVHRTQNSWLWSWSVSPWTTRCCWPAWKGVVASLQEREFRRNRPWPLVHWLSSPPSRPCLLSIGLGLSSPSLRQPIFANETGSVLSTKWLPFVQAALLAAKMVVVSPSEMRTPGKLGLRFS